jgi:arginine/lysine/ornithine decarboxylase
MSSIDACMDKLEREGDEMFRVFTENLEKARRRLSECKYIRLVTPQACECQRVFDFDRSKILLSTVNSSLNGRELHQILRREFHLEMEMEAENYVLALAAVGDTAEGFERLCDAIEEIDRRESLKYREEAVERAPLKNGKMKQVMRISQAMDAESERCPLDECIGRTSGEFAYLYPPGIPLIVPGEQISGHFVKNVRRYLEQGFEVQGLSDQTSETVCVVRNEM